MNNFEAKTANIQDLFRDGLTYEIPSYQRPYSWEKEQIQKFCEDILDAYIRREEYLLSSIILIERESNKLYDVVDGQQRMTTISIFLAVLKSFVHENVQMDIAGRIFKKNSKDIRINRVTTDKSKVDRFSEVLQSFEYTSFKYQLHTNKKISKDRYYNNAIIIYEILQNEKIDFDDFYTFFEEQVFLIKVVVKEQAKAMRLFEVLNARGLPLNNSDLIKNHIIEKIYENYDEQGGEAKTKEIEFSDLWKKIDLGMEELGENIEDLFTYYVYYKLSENPKKTSFEEFQSIYKRDFFNDFEGFRNEIVRFFDYYTGFYDTIDNIGIYRMMHSMKYLKESRFWKTILLSYCMTHGKEQQAFDVLVYELFRFYYLNWIAGETVNPYKQLSFRLIRSIQQNKFDLPKEYSVYQDTVFNPSILREIFDIYNNDRSILARVAKELQENVYGESWAKPLLIILEYHAKESESENIFTKNIKKITIEHIYPQSPQERDEDISLQVNTLGNITLLYGARNASFGNKSFADKKERFKKDHLSDFTMTNEVFAGETWTLQDIEQRKEKLLYMIEKIFQIMIVRN